MKRSFDRSLAALILATTVFSSAGADVNSLKSPWENSVVQLEVSRKQYDYFQPWTKRTKTTQETGLILNGHEILTTADEMFDRTLVRVQKGGRGKWWNGDVRWIDYHANLAIVAVADEAFWPSVKAVELQDSKLTPDQLQILRWREGKLESRKAEFNQFTVDNGRLSFVAHLQIEVSSEVQGIGWGEPIISGSKIVGLASQKEGEKCTAIPAAFIRPILDARRDGSYRGLGYFDFYWQPAENPASLAFLKLEGEPRGVIVIEVPARASEVAVLKAHDVLLQVDGFDIDIQGDYQDPDYGPVSLEGLSTRRKWAGDNVKLKVWREGRALEVNYRLPKADYSRSLVPDAAFDQDPEYLIVGGLLFQPLNDPFLQGWGADWKRRSPFRLYYYNNQQPTPERPALVLLTQVLPDVYNIGYWDLRHLVVDRVNGQKISRLPELREALTKPVNGFHIVEFMQSDSLRRLVLDANQEPAATQRVLQQFRITKEFYFATPPATNNPTAQLSR